MLEASRRGKGRKGKGRGKLCIMCVLRCLVREADK